MNILNISYDSENKSFSTFKTIKNRANQGDTIFIDFDWTICDHSDNPKYTKESVTTITNDEYLKYSKPLPYAVDTIKALSKKYELILVTGAGGKIAKGFKSSDNPLIWKRECLRKWFDKEPLEIFKNIIYISYRDFLIPLGTYLIDDGNIGSRQSGVSEWDKVDKLINIGNKQFPDWKSIGEFLL